MDRRKRPRTDRPLPPTLKSSDASFPFEDRFAFFQKGGKAFLPVFGVTHRGSAVRFDIQSGIQTVIQTGCQRII